jgi:hypothetical protein
MILIETKTLASNQSSVVFTSIPQTFDDLVLLVSARSTRSLALDDCYVTVNSINSGYTGRGIDSNGSSVSIFTNAGSADKFYFMAIVTGATATANIFGNTHIYMPNYTNNQNKSFFFDTVTENNATESYARITTGLLSNTAAITSLTLAPGVGPNFVAGSMFSLYGITKGSDGIVTTSP